jgi:hemerythrin superfamily protein
MTFEIPKALKTEHDELHAELVKATKAGAQTGEAAKAVAKVLHDHFLKEEEYALPPLGLLVPLSQGKFTTEMADVLKLTDKLETELPTMLTEHRDIVAALTRLVGAATAENKPEVVQFAKKLMLHAQAEEQVSYPAALLIGQHVKSKLTA